MTTVYANGVSQNSTNMYSSVGTAKPLTTVGDVIAFDVTGEGSHGFTAVLLTEMTATGNERNAAWRVIKAVYYGGPP